MSDQQTENVKQPENWVEHSQLSTASQAKTRAEIEQEIDAANEPSLIPREEQITQCLAEYLFQELANGTVWRKMKEHIVQHHLATDGTGPAKTKKSPGRTKKTNPDAPVADDRIYQLPISQIKPCPLNPRKRYNAQGIAEFAENIRKVGIIHALLVRPVGVQVGLNYEVIAGHRRLMAATEAGLETAPCLIKEISDEEALDLMLSENLQRADLTPIEEAEGLQSMLELKDLNKAPLYTRESLGQKLGKDPKHITNCLRLLRLPKKAKTALEEGEIGVSIGYLIAKLPTVEMRDRLTKEVLTGYGDGRPLTAREVNDTIARTYMVELKTAPFDTSDANLGPALHMENGERVSGGACSDCPWNSANREDVESKFHHLCMNPACFMAKVQAHTSRVKQRALDSGALVVEGEKADRLIHHDGTPRYDSGFVRLDAKPEHGEIVGGKKAPPWKKMLAGMTTVDIVLDRDKDGTSIKGTATAPVKVQPVVVIDSKGVAHELVERKLAIEAAKKNGYEDLFSTHASRAKSSNDANRLKDQAEENRKKKIQRSEVMLALRELAELVTAKGVPDQAWFAMLEVVLQHAGADGEALVITRREIPIKKVNGSPDKSKSIRDYAEKRLNHGNEMAAFIIELLVAGLIRWQGIRAACFKKVAAVFELPLDGVEQKVKFEMAAAAKKKEKPEEAPAVPDEKKPPVISAKKAAATAKKIRFGGGPDKPKKKALSAPKTFEPNE